MSGPASSRPRILHAPADTGGHAYGLSLGERALGLDSRVAVFAPGRYGYGFDLDLDAGIDHPVWVRIPRRARFLRRAVREYDVFHFNHGQTLLTVRQLGRVFDEAAWLKKRGKTVLVTYQGCDVRPKASCPCRQAHCYAQDRYRGPAAARLLESADRVFFLNPDLRHWLPGARFVPYASVDPREVEPSAEPDAGDVVVVHAPTDEDVKGTPFVVQAVEKLRAEGLPLRLDLVRGVGQSDVLARIAAGHVLIDQLLIGWYGAVALEAMALGRPVLAYIREDEPGDNPFGAELPIVRTSPATLERDLRSLVGDRERRLELGRSGRSFVERHHDPRRVARLVLDGIVPLPEPAYAA